MVPCGRSWEQAEQSRFDGEFIAAANPSMILEMIATFKGRIAYLEHKLTEIDIQC